MRSFLGVAVMVSQLLGRAQSALAAAQRRRAGAGTEHTRVGAATVPEGVVG